MKYLLVTIVKEVMQRIACIPQNTMNVDIHTSMMMRYWFEYIKGSEKNEDGDDDGCTMVLI